MKTNINKIAKVGGIVLGLAFASSAFAASSVVLNPLTVNVTAGQNFTVTVSVNPNGTANYAEKVELKYPSDMLEVTSFTQASGWMQLTQSGYDTIDNTNGVLLKSAGYPNGITSQTTFGTVSFKAKKSGSASITVGSNSQSFEVSGQTAMTGSTSVVTIGAVTSSTVTTPGSSSTVSPGTNQDGTPTEVSTTGDVNAQVAAVGATGVNMVWVWIALVAVVLGSAIYYVIYRMKKAKQKKEVR